MITLRISFALSLITSYTLCNPQTLILFKIEKNKIFLAADTKQVREEKIKTGNEFSIHREIDTVRKIGQANNVYYGIAGTFSGTTTSTVNIPAKYCTKNTSVEKIANNFGNAYSDSVKKFMINLKNFDPDEYEEKYLNSIGLVSAIFMKFENDSAKCVIVNFMITEKNGQLIVKPLIAKIPSKENPYKEGCIGHTEAVANKIHLKETWGKNTVKSMVKLIEQQIDSTGDDVGKPIDLLIIRRMKYAYRRIK